MIVINIDPVLFEIGPLAIRWYGLMYVVGILAGLYVGLPYARAIGIEDEQIWTAFGWGFVGALLGGRLYYVVQQPLGPYLAEPWRIFATWEGGMAFFGAIFGGAIAVAIATWRYRLPYWRLADAGGIFATVGQAFGRIGNIVNGDVIGYPTDLPWGFVYVHPRSFVPEKGVAYHPAAVYELLGNVVIFVILWRLRFRFGTPGMLFAVYLALYSASQFVLFFWRANEIVALGLKQAQWTAIVVLLACVPLVWYLRRVGAPAPSAPAPGRTRLPRVRRRR